MNNNLFSVMCVLLLVVLFNYCVDPEEALVKATNETSDTLYVSLQTGMAIAELDNDSSKWIYTPFYELLPDQESIIGIIYSNNLKEKRKLYVIKRQSLNGKSFEEFKKQIKFDLIQIYSYGDLSRIGYHIRIRGS